MIDPAQLPVVNATLNGLAGVLLVAGYVAIRTRRIAVHRACMLGALALSALFLVSYVYYHWHVGSVRFTGTGWPRVAYYAILFSHIPLAAAIVPMALATAWRALRGRFDSHVRWARVTLPVWLYVSVSGVLVYLLLYVWFTPEHIT